ncbi:polysaccharide lyase family 14 protein [Sparassis crispa]|uniref:Polysaccharide lyase family 14 protein n=1 Tax=Sparassis crispa TaxID=139825 RepID=A0A401GFZ6_9APHY|nr:polysaccharide lyase family 14 protein [Sparassis crispa]GBE81089.1 polysaccharide lyase family 14 protein [Sparassis crispa]
MFPLVLIISTLLCPSFVASTASPVVTPAAVAAKYSLSASTSLPFPTATLSSSDTQSYLSSSWPLQGGIDRGMYLAFVDDPFPTSSPSSSAGIPEPTGPVLQVTYPAGSYSNNTGGAQFYAAWGGSNGAPFNSMVLTYEVAFDSDFNWVMGGKLPGLRGGPDDDGCSGGSGANGSNCFTARLMWRTDGQGEVYSYFLPTSELCASPDFICNNDGYGTSIDRGSFSFVAGAWNRVTLYVGLNSLLNSSDGQVALYYNNTLALTETDLQYRNSSGINIGGLFFSTFFGGSTTAWATPQTVHTYFRDFQMWGSTAAASPVSSSPPASTSTGSKPSGASSVQVAWISLAGVLFVDVFFAGGLFW